METDKENVHYVGEVGQLSANVAELNGVVVMLLAILQTKQSDLPQDVALVVDSSKDCTSCGLTAFDEILSLPA